MHIFFSGIGGAGIGPLAEIAFQAGYEVSGSDKQMSAYIKVLKEKGIKDISTSQSYENISKVHNQKPIDWLVYSSAVTLENPNSPELKFAKDHNIKFTKRDELINQIVLDNNLKLIAVAGTHGKTTTTAMLVWVAYRLNLDVSYLLPAKTSFAELGKFSPTSQYFIIEADEFDRNFLKFKPYHSIITGLAWDHHEIFQTNEEYNQAFLDFIHQSERTLIWASDARKVGVNAKNPGIKVLNMSNEIINTVRLVGFYNRMNAWLVINEIRKITDTSLTKVIDLIEQFPGSSRRMEEIIPNLYSDYAHTPEKITALINITSELTKKNNQKVVIVYEPLTNRRQHYIKESYKNLFNDVSKIYWVPSYLAREDPNQEVLSPSQLIKYLSNPEIAIASELNTKLKNAITNHLDQGDLVVAISGGGGHSLDEWLRENFKR